MGLGWSAERWDGGGGGVDGVRQGGGSGQMERWSCPRVLDDISFGRCKCSGMVTLCPKGRDQQFAWPAMTCSKSLRVCDPLTTDPLPSKIATLFQLCLLSGKSIVQNEVEGWLSIPAPKSPVRSKNTTEGTPPEVNDIPL